LPATTIPFVKKSKRQIHDISAFTVKFLKELLFKSICFKVPAFILI